MTIDRQFIGRFIRFGIVGTSGFLIDFSITALLYEAFAISIIIATGVGFCFGATSNYILNRAWTWKSKDPNVKAEFVKFFAVALIGLAIHYVVLLSCMSMFSLHFTIGDFVINNDWVSKLIATGIVLIWNFLANNFYTFRSTNK